MKTTTHTTNDRPLYGTFSTRWCIVRPTLYTLTEAKIITLFG